jgi:hypothetical protein
MRIEFLLLIIVPYFSLEIYQKYVVAFFAFIFFFQSCGSAIFCLQKSLFVFLFFPLLIK